MVWETLVKVVYMCCFLLGCELCYGSFLGLGNRDARTFEDAVAIQQRHGLRESRMICDLRSSHIHCLPTKPIVVAFPKDPC